MSIIDLTPTQLREAADLLEQIAQLKTELTAILGGEFKTASAVTTPTAPAKRKIRAAQKLRWAKVHAAKAAKPAKRKISAEGIARIKAAQKARWAKINGEKAAK